MEPLPLDTTHQEGLSLCYRRPGEPLSASQTFINIGSVQSSQRKKPVRNSLSRRQSPQGTYFSTWEIVFIVFRCIQGSPHSLSSGRSHKPILRWRSCWEYWSRERGNRTSHVYCLATPLLMIFACFISSGLLASCVPQYPPHFSLPSSKLHTLFLHSL